MRKPRARETYQELSSELHGLEDKLGLRESILHPCSTHVGGSVVNDGVGFPCLEVLAQGGSALVRRDIALEGDATRYRLRLFRYELAET